MEALEISVPSALSIRTVDRLRVETYATRGAVGQASAEAIASAVQARLQVADEVRMIVAAAPSQTETLTRLVKDQRIDWNRVTLFHMDEYIGLPMAADTRFAVWLDRHLFQHVKGATVHKIEPDPEKPEAEAQRYEYLLSEAPIDFVCLGVGVNGHIAFNDPPVANFDDPEDVKVVQLDDVCRQQQVDDECFPSMADVPNLALTLTIPRLLRASQLFCVVPGARKAPAVNSLLTGKISSACPASILRRHDNCTLYLDQESAANV